MAGGRRTRVSELDGLRGIAILMVVTFHLIPTSGPLMAFIRVFQIGWAGVDLFFVLSGFLITGILLDSLGKPGYYRNFVVRRSLRIFPLYYALLALACLLAYAPGEIQWQEFLTHQGGGWFAAYLGNFYVVGLNAWPAIGALIPLWSLQVEEQFYLTYPFLVALCRRGTLMRVLQAMVAGGLLLRIAATLLFPENLVASYVLMPCRMDVLAMGGIVAIAKREQQGWLMSPRVGWVTLISGLAFVATWWFTGGSPWAPIMRTFGYSLVDLAFTGVLILLVIRPPSLFTHICRTPLLVWTGTISYGIYLLHLPAAEIARKYVEPLFGIKPQSSSDMAICVAASVGLASASWLLFESPILRLRDRLVSTSASL